MTKRELIDNILDLNPTADPGFLAGFNENDLHDYLSNLQHRDRMMLTGDSARYAKYFESPEVERKIKPDAVAVLESPDEAPEWLSSDEEDGCAEDPPRKQTQTGPRTRLAHALDKLDDGRTGWLF